MLHLKGSSEDRSAGMESFVMQPLPALMAVLALVLMECSRRSLNAGT